MICRTLSLERGSLYCLLTEGEIINSPWPDLTCAKGIKYRDYLCLSVCLSVSLSLSIYIYIYIYIYMFYTYTQVYIYIHIYILVYIYVDTRETKARPSV